jgi:hypothetical protein
VTGLSHRFSTPCPITVRRERLLDRDRQSIVGSRLDRRLPPSISALGKPGIVTISGKASQDLALGTFNSILKQAGLKINDAHNRS